MIRPAAAPYTAWPAPVLPRGPLGGCGTHPHPRCGLPCSRTRARACAAFDGSPCSRWQTSARVWGGVSPVPAQMWLGWAQSRRRCGRGEPLPRRGCAVGYAQAVAACALSTGTQSLCRCGRGEPSPGADVAGVSPVAACALRCRCGRLWASGPSSTFSVTGLTPPASAPGLGSPHIRICTGTGLAAGHIRAGNGLGPPASVPGWARRARISSRTGFASTTSAPGLGVCISCE
jgi:hypothetical protein